MLEAASVCPHGPGSACVPDVVWGLGPVGLAGLLPAAPRTCPLDAHGDQREPGATEVSSVTRRVRQLWGPVFGCLLGSCSPAGDPVEPRRVPLDTTTANPGDTVQRGSLTVTVTTAGEASQALEALGTPADRVPWAHVRIRRVGESPVEAGTTDSLGHVTFTQLLPGRYDITSLRLLSLAEGIQVAEADSILAGINALGGGAHFRVQPPASAVEVEAAAGRRGALVISEIHDWSPRIVVDGVQYTQAGYIEIYNNSDTTVYLDGKILGHGFWYVWESELNESSLDHCAEFEAWRMDPDGVWSEKHLRFPGTGREYPLAPHDTRVVASQAIDHGEVHPGLGLPDLSIADFEVVGTGQDVDNPAVPNMKHVGFRPSVDALGRGLVNTYYTPFIADNVHLESLPTDELPLRDPDYRRFPTATILDIATVYLDPARLDWDHRVCDHLVNSFFDRQAAPIWDDLAGNAIHRRVLGATPDGRAILQRTKTSAVDLMRGPQSPGRVP